MWRLKQLNCWICWTYEDTVRFLKLKIFSIGSDELEITLKYLKIQKIWNYLKHKKFFPSIPEDDFFKYLNGLNSWIYEGLEEGQKSIISLNKEDKNNSWTAEVFQLTT